MEAIFLKMLNMSIAAGWLILAVIALRMLFRKAPLLFRCLLWILVGIRLISPVMIKSVLSLIPSAETFSPEIIYSESPGIYSGIGFLNQAVNPVISGSVTPQAGADVNQLQFIIFVLSIIWLAGVALLLIYLLFSYLNLRRRVAITIYQGNNIWICDDIDSPFILGIIRPRIYIPSSIEESQIPHVIAHERAHLKRHDHWWKPTGFILLAIYWFNPLIWLAYWLFCRDIELACDEKTISQMCMNERKEYSKALLSSSLPRYLITACPLAFGEVGVKDRIKRVINYRKPSFWLILTALTVGIVLAVCFLTSPLDEPGSSATDHGGIVDLSLSGQVFVSRSCLYMNPFSSMLPSDDNGLIYYISNDSLRITDTDGAEKVMVLAQDSWCWQDMNNSDWDSFFKIDIDKPETYAFANPRLVQISQGYYLFDMDGQLWIGEYRGEKVGMWSIYSLELKQGNQLTLSELLRQAEEKGNLTWNDLRSFPHSDIGSGLYVYELIIDEFWRLLISSAYNLDSDSEIDFPAIFNLEYRPDSESINIHEEDMAAFIARKESTRTEIPFVHSGYSLCAMTSAETKTDPPTIVFNNDHLDKYLVPFSVYISGKEISGGIYTLTDMKKDEQLEFFHPSGLAAQTYILRDTKPGQAYKISFTYNDSGGDTGKTYDFIIIR